MTRTSRYGRLALVALVAGTLAAPAASSAAEKPLGHDCVAKDNGTRFCAGAVVKSFDGVPLDADVTLPPASAGDGPFPTIAFLHGYGGSKTSYEQDDPNALGDKGQAILYHWNNTYYAQRGYAVLDYTARGFGGSCGSPQSRTNPDCQGSLGPPPTQAKSYIHLKDQRWEARDTQFLLGQLVDQGVAKPDALGVTGISYGGGESIELAYLRDKIRDVTDGDKLKPWTSAKGTPLAIAAAYPRWPWSDLVSSLVPNGRFLDFDSATDGLSRFSADGKRSVIGIPIQSFIEGLFAFGAASGFYAPPGTDSSADIVNWHNRIGAGDPYSNDPVAQGIVDEIVAHHQGFGLRQVAGANPTPAPLLIENGWTDDLFPAAEALRVYNDVRSANPGADVALQFGDLGHQRGSNKANTNKVFNDQGSAFMDAHLKGATSPAPPAKGSVTTFTQTCPVTAPGGGPFTAASWPEIHPGAFTFGSAAAQTVTSSGGGQNGPAIDPVASQGNACVTTSDGADPGTAVYRGAKVTGAGFTLMGLPTVQATVKATGVGPQLDSRLWDVGPDGKQTLVSRGAYRLEDNQDSTKTADGKTDPNGKVTLQLHGNGYRFEPGHTPKLELVGTDAPYLQPNKAAFSVAVSNVVVELPTLEKPTSPPGTPGGGQIMRPTISRGKAFKRVVPVLKLRGPARVRQNRRTRLRFLVTTFFAGKNRPVSGVTIRMAHKKVRTNARGRASMVLRFRTAGRRRVRADRRGYRGAKRTVTVVRAHRARRHRRR